MAYDDICFSNETFIEFKVNEQPLADDNTISLAEPEESTMKFLEDMTMLELQAQAKVRDEYNKAEEQVNLAAEDAVRTVYGLIDAHKQYSKTAYRCHGCRLTY